MYVIVLCCFCLLWFFFPKGHPGDKICLAIVEFIGVLVLYSIAILLILPEIEDGPPEISLGIACVGVMLAVLLFLRNWRRFKQG